MKERGYAEKVVKCWKNLGDLNVNNWLLKDKKIKGPLGFVVHKLASAASLRTVMLSLLAPIAGYSIAGAAGIGVVAGIRRGLGMIAGSSGGYALGKKMLERGITSKIKKDKRYGKMGLVLLLMYSLLKRNTMSLLRNIIALMLDVVRERDDYKNLQEKYISKRCGAYA